MANSILEPGKVIGILGGGQLGRMTALAAANLGYQCHIFEPAANCPASHVAKHTAADYLDKAALETFANAVDVVTLEFENVPVEALKFLQERVPVRPGPNVLSIGQDRIREKSFFNKIGIKTAPWKAVDSLEDLESAIAEIGTPCVLKTTTMGYDGKGQFKLNSPEDAQDAIAAMNGAPAILEGFVSFTMEISVIAARSPSGEIATYIPVENQHKNHILDKTIVPAPVSATITQEAMRIASEAVSALELQGLLAIEMFVTNDGEVLVNEMAPRPHNSGHWTQDACDCSQFEQLVRAVANLPLGSTERTHDAVMQNLLGDDILAWEDILKEPGAHLHIYGKEGIKPGRKMGHVNRIIRKS